MGKSILSDDQKQQMNRAIAEGHGDDPKPEGAKPDPIVQDDRSTPTPNPDPGAGKTPPAPPAPEGDSYKVEGIEVTKERLLELAKNGLDYQRRKSEIEKNQDLLRGAQVLDSHVKKVPGLHEFLEDVFRSGKMPQQASSKPEQPSIPPESLPEELDENSKLILQTLQNQISQELRPLKESLAQRERREKEESEEAQKKDYWKKMGDYVDSEMKGYPVFKKYDKAAKEIIFSRVAQGIPPEQAVSYAADLLKGGDVETLKEKIKEGEEKREFGSLTGPGNSPTASTPPKSRSWNDVFGRNNNDSRKHVNDWIENRRRQLSGQ